MSKTSETSAEPPFVAASPAGAEARVRHIRVGDAAAAIPGPGGAHYRCVDFSADFGAWVMFYGPVGGERHG